MGSFGIPNYLVIISTLLLVCHRATGGDGEFDSGFAGSGKVITAVGSLADKGKGVALQKDGRIVVVGDVAVGALWDFGVVRYNANGSLDTSFSSDGKLSFGIGDDEDHASAVVIQPDGRIVVAGYYHDGARLNFAVARLNADGTFDTSFDYDGKVQTAVRASADNRAYDCLLQADGKIVVVGTSTGSDTRICLVRYNPDGSLDASFGVDGKVTTAVGTTVAYGNSVAVTPDGKLVVAGRADTAGVGDFVVARYLPNGAADTAFGANGIVTTPVGPEGDEGNAVALQPDGKIVVAGIAHSGTDNDFAVVRYAATGALDVGFGTGGKLIRPVGVGDDRAFDLVVQPDGRIILVGTAHNGSHNDCAVMRVLADGTADHSFGDRGKVTASVGADDMGVCATLQRDGKLCVAGYTDAGAGLDFFCLRLNAFRGILFEDFDRDYANGGSITNCHGWQGDGLAVATSSACRSGLLGAHIPWGSSVANPHGSGETNRVWIDVHAQLYLREDSSAPRVNAGDTAVFYFNTNGQAVAYDGAVGGWLVLSNDACGHAVAPLSTGAWVRVTVMEHYPSRSWSLLIHDRVFAQRLGFADTNVTASSAFQTENESSLDDLNIGLDYPRSLTGDSTDSDGLGDAWELHYFGSLGQGPTGDFDGDGAPNIVEYREQTDPSDSTSRPLHPGTVFRMR